MTGSLLAMPDHRAMLLGGLRLTALLFALSWLLAAAIGCGLVALRNSRVTALRALAGRVVDYHRNVPGVVQVFVWYFGISALLPATLQRWINRNDGEFSVGRHLRDVLVLSVPRTGALAAGQISLMALVALASTLAAGSVAIFSFAYNLQAVPLTIIGVSYSVAAFPTLARLFAAGERKDFLAHIEQALRHIAFWAIPATVLVIVLRAQLVRVILGAGVFDWSATRLTAAALALFVLSLFAQSAVLIIMRAYYAAGSTKKPLLLAILSVAVSVGSAYALVHLFDNSETVRLWFDTLLRVDAGTAPEAAGNTATVLMLALGYALGSVTQCILGLTLFAQDFNLSLAPLRRLFLQSTFASVLGGLAAYLALAVVGIWLGGLHTLPAIFLQGLLAGLTGLAITALLLHLQQNQELKEITKALHHRIRGVPVTVEPTDLEAA